MAIHALRAHGTLRASTTPPQLLTLGLATAALLSGAGRATGGANSGPGGSQAAIQAAAFAGPRRPAPRGAGPLRRLCFLRGTRMHTPVVRVDADYRHDHGPHVRYPAPRRPARTRATARWQPSWGVGMVRQCPSWQDARICACPWQFTERETPADAASCRGAKPGTPIDLRARGRYPSWVASQNSHAACLAGSPEESLRTFFADVLDTAIRYAASLPEVGQGQARPRVDHVRSSAAALAAYDAAILWGPDVFEPGGLVSRQRTATRNPRYQQLRRVALYEQAWSGIAQKLGDAAAAVNWYADTVEQALSEVRQWAYLVRTAGGSSAAVKIRVLLADEFLTAAETLQSADCGDALRLLDEDEPAPGGVPAHEALNFNQGRKLKSALIRLTKLLTDGREHTACWTAVDDVRTAISKPEAATKSTTQLRGEVRRLLEDVDKAKPSPSPSALRRYGRLLATLAPQAVDMTEGELAKLEALLEKDRIGSVSQVFWWRVHQLLLIAKDQLHSDLDWTVGSFMWPDTRRLSEKSGFSHGLRDSTRLLASTYDPADPSTTTPGHAYINRVWALGQGGES